jgi:outer membrane lipoprotein-sorting protein
MSAVKKILILVLALALVLSFTLVGCTEELPQDEIDRIVTGVTMAQYDTVKLDMDMSMTMEVVGGSEPGEMTMVGDGTGVMDMVNEEMQMIMNMTMDIPELGEQEMGTEVYLVGEWMYTKVDVPVVGEQWIKMKATEGMWEQQSQIEQQIEFLKTAVEINYLGSEAVNGTDCYVFEVLPSVEALGELLSQQASGMGGMDFGQPNLADLFKEMSVREWIAKDSYRVMKTEVGMVMEIRPADVDAAEDDFEKMTIDMNMGMRLYDYNQPVSITLPPEALDAQEMP